VPFKGYNTFVIEGYGHLTPETPSWNKFHSKKKLESKMTESALRGRKPKSIKRKHLLPLSMSEADRPYIIYVREYQRVSQKWTIKRNRQHRVDKTKKSKTRTQYNMSWSSIMLKQTQIT